MCDTRAKRDFLGFFGEGGSVACHRFGTGEKWRGRLSADAMPCRGYNPSFGFADSASYTEEERPPSKAAVQKSRGVLSKKPRAKARGLRKKIILSLFAGSAGETSQYTRA